MSKRNCYICNSLEDVREVIIMLNETVEGLRWKAKSCWNMSVLDAFDKIVKDEIIEALEVDNQLPIKGHEEAIIIKVIVDDILLYFATGGKLNKALGFQTLGNFISGAIDDIKDIEEVLGLTANDILNNVENTSKVLEHITDNEVVKVGDWNEKTV